MLAKNYFSLLFIIFCFKCTQSISLEDAEDIISLTTTVIKSIFRLWETIEPYKDDSDDSDDTVNFSFVNRRQQKIINGIDKLTGIVEQLEGSMAQMSAATIQKLEQNIVDKIRFDDKLTDLVNTVAGIESHYDQFLDIQSVFKSSRQQRQSNQQPPDVKRKLYSNSTFEQYTVNGFVNSVTGFGENSVRRQTEHVHELIAPRQSMPLVNQQGILDLVQEHFQNHLRCSLKQSLQQTVYNLFTSLTLIQLKGYIMMQYSYMMLRIYKKGNFTTEKQQLTTKFNERFKEQIEITKNVISRSDNSMWRCDPPNEKKELDDTYTELTRLLQGYIQNENDLSPQHTCSEGCGYYRYVEYQSCTKDTFCAKQDRCSGKLVECRHVDNDMSVCVKKSSDSRRYGYIYARGKKFTLGQNTDDCEAKYTIKSWRRYFFVHCYYCLCICDEESDLSDRYFNLREYLSDLANNKVIVGVRFVKHNRIIHLQIKQARLLSKGRIDTRTLEWLPLYNYTVETGTRGADYHTLSYEQRAVDLDDLKASDRQLVTGVRFRLVGAHLNMEIRLTSFNFEKGILDTARNQWIGNDNTDASDQNPRREFKLPSRKLPNEYVDSVIDIHKDSFLQFTYSDEDEDAAQSTVPRIDTQPVEPNPPAPLSGLGISHKGTKWTSGYLMPKLFTHNMVDYLELHDVDLNAADDEHHEVAEDARS